MTSNNRLILKNCQLYNVPNDKLNTVVVESGRIRSVGSYKSSNSDHVIDIDGNILAPGLIDIHIQGAGGCDILDGEPAALQTMSRTLARFGVAGFLATTVMDPDSRNEHLNVLAQHWQDDPGGARILGCHLEGPFINPQKRGGIAPQAIYPPGQGRISEIVDILRNSLKMMTIAPEIKGNQAIIDELIRRHCLPSFGHSMANYGQARAAFQNGIHHVTHMFNAMQALHHREPGPLLAVLESGDVSVQIISDGVHLHPAVVRFLYNALGVDRCICITDGIQAIGLPEGRYTYNGRDYISKDGTARYEDGTLIGTALALNNIAARFQAFTSCTMEEAINSVSLNPARLLGIDGQKGSIESGKDADLVVMNPDFSVEMTIIAGEVVFDRRNRN